MPCTWTGYGEPLPRLPIKTGGRKGKKGETERERETKNCLERNKVTEIERRSNDRREEEERPQPAAATPTPPGAQTQQHCPTIVSLP
jgi:hypothetical protein